jgi:hypothetical protein
MNETIPLENLINPFLLPRELDYSSDSFVNSVDKTEEQVVNDKFLILKNNIGEELYDKLSSEQKVFITSVSGTINLGKFVNIEAIYNDIEKIENE